MTRTDSTDDQTDSGLMEIISAHPIESGIIVLDVLAAGLYFGRLAFGLNAEPDDHFARFIFSNTFPHIILGLAPFATAAYLTYRTYAELLKSRFQDAKTHILAVTLGALSTSPVYLREFEQYTKGAKDSLNDSLETAAGALIGILCLYPIYRYISNRYFRSAR